MYTYKEFDTSFKLISMYLHTLPRTIDRKIDIDRQLKTMIARLNRNIKVNIELPQSKIRLGIRFIGQVCVHIQ